MLPYWLLFALPAFFTFNRPLSKLPYWLTVFCVFFFSIFIGLRLEVGGDWSTYLLQQQYGATQALQAVLLNPSNDPAYEFFSWISFYSGLGIFGVNFICALIFSSCLLFYTNQLPRPWFALTLSVPYLIIVVAMGYTRQSVAIGLVMAAIAFIGRQKLLPSVFCIVTASLFHKTALLSIIFLWPFISSSRTLSAALVKFGLVSFSSFGLYIAFLSSKVNFLIYGYLDQQQDSEGALVRVLMTVIPALIYLLFRQRFSISPYQRFPYLFISLLSIACFSGLILTSGNSTFIDRVALYALPLQLFVGSHFPDLGLVKLPKPLVTFAVGATAFLLQFVWLNFAATAFAWLPYQNLLPFPFT